MTWASMVTGFVKEGRNWEAIRVLREMMRAGVRVNPFALSAAVKAAIGVSDEGITGRCFHGVVLGNGFGENVVIGSVLIDMYGKNGDVGDARKVFDETLERDAVCWSSVVSALVRNDQFEEGLGMFWVMQRRDRERLVPDGYTYGSLLTACGNLGRLRQGREVNARLVIADLIGNVVTESSLVDMYGKCGRTGESQRVFDRMQNKNPVTWCALLSGYCQNGEFESVLELFREMEPRDLYCFGTVLRACAGLAAVEQGKEVHCQYLRKGGWKDVIVESALVDLYAKSGHVNYARRIFHQMAAKNLISWNSMICGLAQNGHGEEAVDIYNRMIEEGIKPEYITFVGVLFACSHAGLVDHGREYFHSMNEKYGVKPGIEHFNCMVDLLGRGGLVEEVEDLIQKADCKDVASLWPALLGSCITCRNFTAAERVAKSMIEHDPENHLSYVHLTNVYKAVGRWNDAIKIRELMKRRGVDKMPGRSWVE